MRDVAVSGDASAVDAVSSVVCLVVEAKGRKDERREKVSRQQFVVSLAAVAVGLIYFVMSSQADEPPRSRWPPARVRWQRCVAA